MRDGTCCYRITNGVAKYFVGQRRLRRFSLGALHQSKLRAGEFTALVLRRKQEIHFLSFLMWLFWQTSSPSPRKGNRTRNDVLSRSITVLEIYVTTCCRDMYSGFFFFRTSGYGVVSPPGYGVVLSFSPSPRLFSLLSLHAAWVSQME